MRRRIALQKHFAQKLAKKRLLHFGKLGSAHASSRRFSDSQYAYAPMRRNVNVVSGLITSPFISSSG
jgi:hypothetical protein